MPGTTGLPEAPFGLQFRYVHPKDLPKVQQPPQTGADTAINQSYPLNSSRFLTPVEATSFFTNQSITATPRTRAALTVGSYHRFAPLDASKIVFANDTQSSDSVGRLSQRTPLSTQHKGHETQQPAKRHKTRHGSVQAGKPYLQIRNMNRSGKSSSTTLRMNHPIRNGKDIPADVWETICINSGLKFCLEARLIKRSINAFLQYEKNWKKCREKEFGPDMPSPGGLFSEKKYADLLVGRGCNVGRCTKTSTSKTYWIFRARFCSDCLRHNTVKRDELGDRDLHLNERLTLLDLIPAAITHSGKYQRSRGYDEVLGQWESTASSILYLRRDFDKVEADYQALLPHEKSHAAISTWAAEKLATIMELTKHVQEIERWSRSLPNNIELWHEERARFFESKAAQLSPPMSKDVLHRMYAYHQSLKVNRKPTDRAWSGLCAKILPFRGEAEGLLQLMNSGPSGRPLTIFEELHTHRSAHQQECGTLQPEQEFIIKMGHNALRRCQQRNVADADLVLACLQAVFDNYAALPLSSRPIGVNADGCHGVYVLTLDDARMIVEEVLLPLVGDHSQRKPAIFEQFRCVACTRKDSRRWSFHKGFEHILHKHANMVGEDHQYYKLFQPLPQSADGSSSAFLYPWYLVKWPRCLPLVPGYFEVKRELKWDPEGHIDYRSRGDSSSKSTFEGVHAYANPEIKADDFTGNLVWAAKMLKKTTLDSVCQTKIMLQYALDRYNGDQPRCPTLDLFAESVRVIQAVNPRMDFRFRCAMCRKNENIHRTNRFIKKTVPWYELRGHWEKNHMESLPKKHLHSLGREEELDWPRFMMDLPTDSELWAAMARADEELRQTQDAVREREKKREKAPKMKADPKANLVLSMEESMVAFRRVFVES